MKWQDGEYYDKVTIEMFGSGNPGTKIRNAVTGAKTPYLVGSLNEESSIQVEYYNKVKSYLESNKLNFELYYNLERDKLLQLYSEASIYWHFTGFNEDLKNKPELAEHFGITLVEAIAHGCIPFAFNAGGQVEILECLKSNNTFSNFDELENKMHLITISNNFEINQNFKKNFFIEKKL
jgi:glycosyltransferase involved in cell wall biosynthesis